MSAVVSWMNAVDSPKVSGSDTIEAIFSRQQFINDIGLVRIASGYTVSKGKNNSSSNEKTSDYFSVWALLYKRICHLALAKLVFKLRTVRGYENCFPSYYVIFLCVML